MRNIRLRPTPVRRSEPYNWRKVKAATEDAVAAAAFVVAALFIVACVYGIPVLLRVLSDN